MTKPLILVLTGLAICAFIWMERNSTKTAYVNGIAKYNSLPGQEYIFEKDCYIFKDKKHPSSFPLVGANSPGSSGSISALPTEVSSEFLGKPYPNIRLLDVVKVGTRFKIASVRREINREWTRLTLEILFIDEADRLYPRLDAYYMLDHSGDPEKAPEILPEFAVERQKK